MEQWILPKVQEWSETIKNPGRFAVKYLQKSYSGLVVSLQT